MEQALDFKPARILIVDDETQNRDLLVVMLTPDDFRLSTASSGEDALEQIARQAPDLILLDLMMPGIDGFEVAARLKTEAATKNIPIIMVTALNDLVTRMRGLDAGAEEFLTKPIHRPELRLRVRNMLRLKAYGEASEQILKDQMRFKDEFLSHVSHELRSPLTAIKQFTTILAGGLAGELNEEQQEYQQIVLRNIRQLQSMIDDLLEVTRLETGKLTIEPESASIASAAAEVLQTLQETARAKGVSLALNLAAGLPPAFADPTRLRQILTNLVENAVKFTPSGGSVTISARVKSDDPTRLLVEVSDTGRGVGPEGGERLFERLHQEPQPDEFSRKGLGLGLYLCRELVTRQGGAIWIDGSDSPGCTVSMTLPVFSLAGLIAPRFTGGHWPGTTLALVVINSQLLDVSLTADAREQWSREVRALLERCVQPDRDLVLPGGHCGVEFESHFAAVFADAQGAGAVIRRFRDQLEIRAHLKAGRNVSLSFVLMQTRSGGLESSVAQLADRLETSIQSHLNPGVA